MFQKKIAYFFILLFLINSYNANSHEIELYTNNQNSFNTIFSHVNILLTTGLKNIHTIYQIISNSNQNPLDIIKYIEVLYQKIILLKNENISIDKKIIKLFQLIKEHIPNKENQELVRMIYRKILNIFL